MKQAPEWLPDRIRDRLDSHRINRALRGVLRTRPYEAAPPEQADAELNMLLCKRDLLLGLVALKSLLRFRELKLSVTLVDDGSLSRPDREQIDAHIPGTRWQPRRSDGPEIAELLAGFPRLSELYFQSSFLFVTKLLHPLILSRTERVIQCDSDAAFFRRPIRLIEFCKGNDLRPLYLHDHQDESSAVPTEVHVALAELEASIAEPGRQWQVGHRFFNAGLLIYRRDHLDLAIAESYLAWRQKLPPARQEGKLGIWFGPWTIEQTCYLTMYSLGKASPEPLGDDYWIGGGEGHVFNHFLRHYVVQVETLRQLSRLIEEF